jgi:hypothetical protein
VSAIELRFCLFDPGFNSVESKPLSEELRFCLFDPGFNSIESKPLSEELSFILLPVSAELFLLSSDRSCALAPEIGKEIIVMRPTTVKTARKRPLVVLKLRNFFPLDTAAEKDW